MATGVEELLDMAFEMVDDAKSVPLSSDKCIVERDRLLDLLDDIRANFPKELTEARRLLADKAEVVAQAKREAEMVRKRAEDEARRLLSQDELLSQAKQKGTEMIRQAEERSRELRRAANEYCEDALRRTEEAVSEALDEVKRSRARFRAAAGSSAPQSQGNRQIFDAQAEEN